MVDELSSGCRHVKFDLGGPWTHDDDMAAFGRLRHGTRGRAGQVGQDKSPLPLRRHVRSVASCVPFLRGLKGLGV